ncbi:uncharacterized protein FIBRA_03134 [Fibroporia radiculosa]|uniref:Cytochrome P450 n=1 Tax=Fibroporia radiculosa TaxID=599839 RepID=J4I9F8_9APHY|nr:uncharacterized protein FIBRA_03134 [Fibroporia radiculosa]CCM01086.1 predicted protein [Fibroporia radiculosa]
MTKLDTLGWLTVPARRHMSGTEKTTALSKMQYTSPLHDMGYIDLISSTVFMGFAWVIWGYFRKRRVSSVLKNLPGPRSTSFLYGHFGDFFGRHGTEFNKEVALKYGAVCKMNGMLGRTVLYVSDPKALHTIILKEEHIYQESEGFIAALKLIFGPSLTSTLGEVHRKQRKMLNPVFSVAHMRNMIPLFYGVSFKLRTAITQRVAQGPQELDVLGWTGRTALELIGQGGFGYSFDSLTEDSQDAFGEALKDLSPNLQKFDHSRYFISLFAALGPAWLRRRLVELVPSKDLQRVLSIIDIMTQKSIEVYQDKKAALARGDRAVVQQIGEGKDLMSILIKANSAASKGNRLSEEELIAQISSFVFAGMDTTSNSISRILHILAQRPEVQDKLREEILAAGAGENISYEDLNKLSLLDAVCRETLRVFPPVTGLTRVATKDSVLPLSEPIMGLDGTLITEIPIPEGTELIVGTMGSNLRPAVWGEDSLEWKPERWLLPLPTKVTDASIPGVYSNLMTFLGGKRACIGFKFSEMEMKVVLSVLLSTFRFEESDKPVIWNVGAVWYPTVGSESNVSELRLKVSLLDARKA